MKKTHSQDTKDSGKGHIFPSREKGRLAELSGPYFRAGVIGLHPLSGILVGSTLGYILWKRFDAQWLFPVCLIAGLAGGCLTAFRDIRAMTREQDAENAGKKPPRH